MMRTSGFIGSIGGIRRKLRALAAVMEDPGATEHERANAELLKTRLEQRLREAGVPTGDWTDIAFRLGKWAKQTSGFAGLASTKGDWTQNAFRLGKTLRRGYKKWSSDE
jgi:hypothetical protein